MGGHLHLLKKARNEVNENSSLGHNILSLQEKQEYLMKLADNITHVKRIIHMVDIVRYQDTQTNETKYSVFVIRKLTDSDKSKWTRNTFRNECTMRRLVQFSGTCYLNAVMNTLIMPVEIRKLCVDNYNAKVKTASNPNEYKLSLDELYKMQHGSAAQFFYSMLYHSIVKKERLIFTNDIMEKLGRVIKEIYNQKYNVGDSNYHQSGVGGHDVLSMLVIINMMNEVSIYKNSNFCNLLHNIQNKVNYVMQEKSDMLIFLWSGVYITDSKKEFTLPKKVSITVKGIGKNVKYRLCSACFQFKQEGLVHSVMGYICDGKPYMFDSNNYITQDDWTNGDFSFFKFNMQQIGKLEKITIIYSVYILDE